jgi:hypothetical protein
MDILLVVIILVDIGDYIDIILMAINSYWWFFY